MGRMEVTRDVVDDARKSQSNAERIQDMFAIFTLVSLQPCVTGS
jgi:hypothetical protein